MPTFLTEEEWAADEMTSPGALPCLQTAPHLQDLIEALWEDRRFRPVEHRPAALARVIGATRVQTDPALSAEEADHALTAHRAGDWGNVPEAQAPFNEAALMDRDLMGSIVSRDGRAVVMTTLGPTGSVTQVVADPLGTHSLPRSDRLAGARVPSLGTSESRHGR